MSREEHFYFMSCEGQIRSHGMRWIPDGAVRMVLQISHGMAEHIERYREFGNYLAQRGILVVGHDHLGHGMTAPSVQEYGYISDLNGNRNLVGDIHKVLRLTKNRYPNVPYILLGHSMGSFLARQYLYEHGQELDGAILCGTAYQPSALTRFGMALCRAEAKIFGWHYRSRLIWLLCFGSYNHRFSRSPFGAQWLTTDEAIVRHYMEDSKCGFSFTLNGYYNLFHTLYNIVQKENLQNMPPDLPVFFIAGEEDPVGSYGAGVRKVVQMFCDSKMHRVTCRFYPGARHELLNERERRQVFRDIEEWLENLAGI